MNDERWRTFLSLGGPESGNCAPNVTRKGIEELSRAIPKNASVLDVGAGHLEYSNLLQSMGYTVNAVDDHYPDPLAYSGDITMVRGDMHDLPLSDGTYDAVFANHVLEHAIAPLIAMHEFARVLKPGGVLYVGVPDHIERWVKDRYSGHYFVPTKIQLENLAEAVGFELVYYKLLSEDENSTDATLVMQVFLFKKKTEGVLK